MSAFGTGSSLLPGKLEFAVSAFAMVQADSATISKIALSMDAGLAKGYRYASWFGWAAQVVRKFAEHSRSSPLMASTPVEARPDELLCIP